MSLPSERIRDPGRDEQPGSYIRELKKLFSGLKYFKFFDVDPGSVIRIRDGKIRIRDKNPGSATLARLMSAGCRPPPPPFVCAREGR
jgi:hypothetical protein